MIEHPYETNYNTPYGVTEQQKAAARNRRGEWELTTWDWDIETVSIDCWFFVRWWCELRAFFRGWYRFVYYKLRNAYAWIVWVVSLGFWVIPYDYDDDMQLFCTKIRMTEHEVPRIQHFIMHGHRNNTKWNNTAGNLEQCAQTLWPTGSLEHVAMRNLAVVMMSRVVHGHRIDNPMSTGSHDRYLKSEMIWVGQTLSDTQSSGALNHSDGKDAIPRDADGDKPGAGGAAGPPAEPKAQEAPKKEQKASTVNIKVNEATMKKAPRMVLPPEDTAGEHGGKTPEDAEIIANEQVFWGCGKIEAGRLVDINGIKAIVGQEFDGEKDSKQIVGVLTAPTPCKPNVYSNSSRNAIAAKRERLDKKARPFKGTKSDIKKINKLIGEACGNRVDRAIFSTKRIQQWAEKFFHLADIKSGKWSAERLESSLNDLMKEAFPEYNLKCAVKLEPMQEGKPPRLLIADGDGGQIMALVIVKCFEDLLFEWFENKSIKHCSKREAIDRCIERLRKKGAKLIEGDGSAWDTTCNSMIRSLVENPVLKHIMQVLIPYGVVPEQWHREHMNCCDKQKLKLFFQKKFDKVRITIDAIRRSGHRGTSCLNWWMNFVNWACSIFKQPEAFLNPSTRKGMDETGHMRWWNGNFEGDDSLCGLFPPMCEGDEMSELFAGTSEVSLPDGSKQVKMGWWDRMGFNMKIVYCDRRATFCGYHIACVDGAPTGFACPELPRAMTNAGVSCSASIIAAAKAGDVGTVRDIAAAGAIARAADFAGKLPSVSRKFHNYANHVKRSREIVDREMSMRVFGEEGHTYSAIEESIEQQNAQVTPTEELARLEALLCPATLKELDTFTLHAWTFEGIGAHEEFRDSLPASWRPPPDPKAAPSEPPAPQAPTYVDDRFFN